MAFEEYVPKTNVFHPTVSMPDDAQMRINGIGAFNTPLQQLADNTSRINEIVKRGIGEHQESWHVSVGAFPDIIFGFEYTTARMYGAISFQNELVIVKLSECIPGDLIQCQSTIVVTTDGQPYVGSVSMQVSNMETIATIAKCYTHQSGSYHFTLIGQYKCTKASDLGVFLWLEKIETTIERSVKVVDELHISATRWRAV